jgi:two-component system, NarL family, sensor histidine kinase UhpB
LADREIQGEAGRKMAARRDAALIVVISIAAAVICVKLDLSEVLLGWTRLHERLQLDELPALLLVVACCLVWFSARRHAEARDQLVLRRATDARLAEALAENQRLAQQYVDMQEYERKALARDLHDELGQYLNVIKLDAVSIRDTTQSGNEGGSAALARNAARAMIENVDRVYGVVSSLIRQLRPVGFDELGVAAALENCVNDWRARLPEMDIELSMDSGFDDPHEIRALALFRLVQEALTNVARHSRATRVEIRVARTRRSETREFIEVSIIDDGRGTDLEAPHTGLGLVGMRERVAAFGGSLKLVSARGAGFQVMASIPVLDRPMTGRPA